MYSWAPATALGLTLVFSFALGVFTLLTNPKVRTTQLWFLTSMGISIWSFGLMAFIITIPDESLGTLFIKIIHVGATTISIFFFHFILDFTFKVRDYKWPLYAGYFFTVFFLVMILVSDLVIKFEPLGKLGFETWAAIGPLFSFYIIYFHLYVVLSLVVLYKAFKSSDGIRRTQIFYIILAALVGFGGGTTVFLTHYFDIYPFGVFIIFLYPLLITYGIFFPTARIKIIR